MKDYTTRPTTQPTPHHVTVRRVLLADETPVALDEIDMLVLAAASHSMRWGQT